MTTTTATDANDPLLRTEQAAAFLGLSPGTLANLRVAGTGPRYVKLNTSVRYKPADLVAWAEARAVETNES